MVAFLGSNGLDVVAESAGANYQVFRICEDRCQKLNVTIVRGKGITRGRIKDWRNYQ